MLSRVCMSVAVVLLGAGSLSVEARPEVAVSLDPKPLAGTPTPDWVHGWQFDVNGPIVVTHLGLFDDDDDGFSIDFPIGLFRLSDEVLLTSGTMSAGTGDALLDHFRYIDTSDVALQVDETYVIAFYTSRNNSDLVITDARNLVVASEITITNARGGSHQGGLRMPPDIQAGDRFGPNFQFVPEPATIGLFGVAACFGMRRRR